MEAHVHDHLMPGAVAVLLGIAGVAALAVILSPKAGTPGVLGAAGSSIGQMLCVALSPITGGSCGGTANTPPVPCVPGAGGRFLPTGGC